MVNFRDAEVLITGGAGFIGSNLADELVKKKAKVTVIDAMIEPYGGNKFNLKNIKNNIKFVKSDIRSTQEIKKVVNGKDFIFHLAGQTGRSISMANPRLDTSINCLGTLVLLEAIRKLNRKPKIIFSGSRGSVGEPKYLPVNEKHPDNPKDVYGINKLAAESYCLLFGKVYGFGATSLRLNNVYGPKCQVKSNHYGTINLFVSYALQKKVIPVYGSGLQTRDYIFISDVVDAFLKAADSKADGQKFFVGTGIPTSIVEVIKIIQKEIPETEYKKIKFPDDLKSVDFMHFYSDSSKLSRTLSWKPKVNINAGIKKTILYYRKHLNKYL